MGLPLSILWGNTLNESVILVDNDFPSIVGAERKWYLLERSKSLPFRLFGIQATPPHGHPAHILAHEEIFVVTMPGVAETFKTVIDEMTHRTNFKQVNLLHAKNVNHTNDDLNTSIDEPENRWNIHLVSYDTLTSRAKPSSNGRLSHCSWSSGMFDESHRYRMKNSVGWRIARNARIGFKLRVTGTPGFHSLYDLCIRQCGCLQVCLSIQRMILWGKSTLPMHCIPLLRVWCTPAGLKTMTLHSMQHTGWSILQSPGLSAGGQNHNSSMGNHLFGYQWRMHTLLISKGLRKSKLN